MVLGFTASGTLLVPGIIGVVDGDGIVPVTAGDVDDPRLNFGIERKLVDCVGVASKGVVVPPELVCCDICWIALTENPALTGRGCCIGIELIGGTCPIVDGPVEDMTGFIGCEEGEIEGVGRGLGGCTNARNSSSDDCSLMIL